MTLLRPNQPLGFFVPYRFAATARRRAQTHFYRPVETVFRHEEESFLQLLEAAAAYETAFEAIGTEPPPEPRWDQNWFAGLDAIAAYTLVRREKPARIVEVGAGHSTRFFATAIQDSGAGTKLTSIDPEPRARISGLPVHRENCLVTEVRDDLWSSLRSGDFLSIDSSHILMPGTDVDFLLNNILPFLPEGVFIHFHDVFLPDPYPAAWQWRQYNEQSAIAMLVTGGGYRPIFASHYVSTRHPGRIQESFIARFARLTGAPVSSLWLQKTSRDSV